MITIKKLKTLKDSTQHRKIIKILYELEQNLSSNLENSQNNLEYTKQLLQLIKIKNPELETQVAKIINSEKQIDTRELSNLRYKLQSKIGEYPADWDLNIKSGELDKKARKILPISLYLEDLRAPFNIGSIFRSAESFGVEHIYLSPNCPEVTNKKVCRTAMGTEKVVPHSVAKLEDLAKKYPIVALETGGTSVENFTFPKKKFVLVVGNEELGISPQALQIAKSSSGVVTIPICGYKASINVGVATGILLSHYMISNS